MFACNGQGRAMFKTRGKVPTGTKWQSTALSPFWSLFRSSSSTSAFLSNSEPLAYSSSSTGSRNCMESTPVCRVWQTNRQIDSIFLNTVLWLNNVQRRAVTEDVGGTIIQSNQPTCTSIALTGNKDIKKVRATWHGGITEIPNASACGQWDTTPGTAQWKIGAIPITAGIEFSWP